MSGNMCRMFRSFHYPVPLYVRTYSSRSSNLRSTQNDAQSLVHNVPNQEKETAPTKHLGPYELVQDELNQVHNLIQQQVAQCTQIVELREASQYYFNGQRKSFRPMLTLLMARALNFHSYKEDIPLLYGQRQVAMVAEMLHTASLVHDDVIDDADFRRGKSSINAVWNTKKGAMVGDFLCSAAFMVISRVNHDVIFYCTQAVSDLVTGELTQLNQSGTSVNELFSNYLHKTYCKTASPIANQLKSVAFLACSDDEVHSLAFEYGRHVGLAFQLIDDVLDFEASSDQLGKPAGADLKLGLATAPVLVACENFPELQKMIMRRFTAPGDPERAVQLVCRSRGLEQTRLMAQQHCEQARRLAGQLRSSPYQRALLEVPSMVLNRRN